MQKKPFLILIVLFLLKALLLHAQVDEPQKPYNFYNKDAQGKQYCWLLGSLQCLYRLKPIHELLNTLDENKSKAPEAFRVAQVLQQVFTDMTDCSKFTSTKRYFPEILKQISLEEGIQKMFNKKFSDIKEKEEEWDKKFYQGPILSSSELSAYLKFRLQIDKYYFSDNYLKRIKEPIGGNSVNTLGFFIKILGRAFLKNEVKKYFELIPLGIGRKKSINGYDNFHVYINPVLQSRSLIFFESGVNYLREELYTGVNFMRYNLTNEPVTDERIIIKGKNYELVAMVMEGTQLGFGHAKALVKYDGSWHEYDSYYGGKEAKLLVGPLSNILNNESGRANPSQSQQYVYHPCIFFYQEVIDLSSVLKKLQCALEGLKEKLFQFKIQLEMLKNKLKS